MTEYSFQKLKLGDFQTYLELQKSISLNSLLLINTKNEIVKRKISAYLFYFLINGNFLDSNDLINYSFIDSLFPRNENFEVGINKIISKLGLNPKITKELIYDEVPELRTFTKGRELDKRLRGGLIWKCMLLAKDKVLLVDALPKTSPGIVQSENVLKLIQNNKSVVSMNNIFINGETSKTNVEVLD